MQRSRSLALMFLLGALLVGNRCARNGDNRRSFTWLTEELNLTAEQSAAVDSIVERRHREMRAVIAPVRPQMDAVRDTARHQIRRVLDDAQRARFDELIAKQHSEKKQK